MNIDKLETLSVDLKKCIDVVDKDVVKKSKQKVVKLEL